MEKADLILRINRKWITGYIGLGSSVKAGQTLIGVVVDARDEGEDRIIYVLFDKDIQLSRPA